MATTLRADLYAPEVWEDLAQAEFEGKVVVFNSGAVLQDDTLVGQPGETISFPSWMGLSDMEDLEETEVIVPEKLKQKNTQATIKEAGKGVEISDRASLVGLGNPQAEAIRQFGELSARKVDGDLIAAATATIAGGVNYADGSAATASAPLSFSSAAGAPISWDLFAEAVEQFGDDFEPSEFGGLYIRAEQRTQVWKDPNFIKASELSAAGSVVSRGQIGDIGGLPVFVSNRIQAGRFLILKNQSLGVMYKRRPIVEQDRDILARHTVVTTNMHYATKRLNDKGVLVGTLTPAA